MTKPVSPLASSQLSRPGYKVANLERNFFYRYETYPDDESRSVEFKALTKTKQVVLRVMEYSEKYLVAFLNAEGGKTLFGILDDGLIMGLKLSRRTRDEIRLGIDRTVGRIRPVVTNDLYTVKFFPVLDRSVQLEDFFVICLECKKGNNIYVDSKDV